jgi:hypothetical protein
MPAELWAAVDRLLFRGTIRMPSAPQGMRSYLWHQRVLLTEFAAHVHKVSTRLKDALVQSVEQAGRPVLYLQKGQ